MLIRMLRADLRRGVAQSAALTVLIALAVALAAMSTTLGIRAGSAVNALWKRAVPPDVAHMHTGTPDANALRAWVDRRSDVADYHLMRTLPVPVQQLTIAGKSQADSVLEPAFVTAPKRFDLLLGQDGKPANPGPGEIALPVHYKAQGAAAVGDTVRVRSGSWGRELKVVDFVRDPQMNPSMVTSKRLVVHPSDFAEFDKRLKPEYIVEFRLADGVEASAFVKAFESSGLSSQGITVDTSIFKLMNGLTTVPVAAVALLVAILLAVVAALVLRYAFLAAMEEDLAQISVLKAIGAPPRGVKRLYLAKYSALTAGGALVGYLLSIPMAAQLSDAVLLYLGKSSAGAWPILCSIAAAVALAALMVGFCWILLRRIDRLSAVQALRTGVSGRVRRRRHRLSLASSRRLPVDVWLGLREAFRPANALLLAVLTVCTIVLILPANVVTTMGDPGFASYMGIGRADLRIDVPAGSADLDTAYSKVAAEAGVGRAVQMTDHRYDMRKPGGAWGSALVESGDQSAFSGRYLRGRAPATAKEIALSSNQADEAKVGLGDVVDVRLPASPGGPGRPAAAERTVSLRVVGLYQDITNGGKTAKTTEAAVAGDASTPLRRVVYADVAGGADAKATAQSLRQRLPGASVAQVSEYISQTLGATLSQMRSVAVFSAAVAIALAFLVAALFAVLVVARESSQIGIQRGIGMSTRRLRVQYLVRFCAVLLAGVVLGTTVVETLGEAAVGGVLGYMGAPDIAFMTNPWLVRLVLPGALALAVVAAVLLAMRRVRMTTVLDRE